MQPTQTNNSKTLTSLALIETQLLSKDYLSTFLPFIATLILKKDYKDIDIGIIVQDFKDEYGINIPRAPMQAILSRAVNSNLITPYQDGKYLPALSEIKEISFLSQQNQQKIEIDTFLNNFIGFVTRKHGIVISYTEAIDIFISFLDEYSPRTVSGEYNNDENVQFTLNRNLYLMGEYIQSTVQTDLSLFETIRKLAMAYLITTALTFDEPVETRTSEFSELTIYLDSPIVLRLLGLQTEELEKSYTAMFENFQSVINPKFMIFQHTLDEVSGIIADCANWIDNPAYNPMYANPALLTFIKRNFSKTQVELYKNTLEERLNELNITIDDKEYYHVVHKSAQIDITTLKNKIIEAYSTNNPRFDVIRSEVSIDYDIRSIENIVKLWGTKSSRSYNSLGYLFITSNSTLAYVSRKFTSEYWWNNKNHKTPCVTDYYLGTMVWLSTPSDRIENVSKLKLLADCSAATTLSREIMEKFSIALKSLEQTNGIKSGDYLLLRKYAYEKNYLQHLTLNDESAFKDDIIDQLLEDIKADLQRPLIETIQEKDLQISDLEIKKYEQDELIQLLKDEKESEQLSQATIKAEIKGQAIKTTDRIINTFAPIIFAAFALAAVICQLVPRFANWSVLIKAVSALISFGSAIFFGVMKSNLFGLHEKFITSISNYYKIKRFKDNLD